MLRRFYFWLRRCRLRSELFALRLAKSVPLLAMLPISANCCFWYFIFCIPIIPPAILLLSIDYYDQPSWLGLAIFVPATIIAMGVIVIVLPWLWEWYFIALTLTFGRKTRAEKKESWLSNELNAP